MKVSRPIISENENFVISVDFGEVEIIGLALQHLRDSETWDNGREVEPVTQEYITHLLNDMWDQQQPLLTESELENNKAAEREEERENEQATDTNSGEEEFAFDNQECAAMAHDLTILQLAEGDRSELNFSVADLELIIRIAKGDFNLIEENIE